MEIQPATIEQVQRAKGGAMIAIEDDVGGIAKQIAEIDPSLGLRYSMAGQYFVVYQVYERDGEQHRGLVTTAQELDGRLLDRVREIVSENYNVADELDKIDAQHERDRKHNLYEQVGEVGEKLAHAIRKDTASQSRVFVPHGRRGRAT